MTIDHIVKKSQYHNDTYVALPNPHNDEFGILVFGQQNKDAEKLRSEIMTVADTYFDYRHYQLIGAKEEKSYDTKLLRLKRNLYQNEDGKRCRFTVKHLETQGGKGYHPSQRNNDFRETPSNMSKSKYLVYFAGPWSILKKSVDENFEEGKYPFTFKGDRHSILVTPATGKDFRDEFLRYLEMKKYGYAP